MQKVRSEFPEIEEIKNDIDSLKSNVVELSRHIKSEGNIQASKLTEIARDSLESLRKSAKFEYQKAERHVKSKPGQSVAVAFAAGILCSMLLGRK